jgi:hypothetical protein
VSQLDNWHTAGNNRDRELVQNWLTNAKKICRRAFWELLKVAKSGIVWLDVERSGNEMLLEYFDI